MKRKAPHDPSNMTMLELFRVEAENQATLLTEGLLELERLMAAGETGGELATWLESLMRAAHSLKGAARIVNLPAAVRLAHGMEDCFVGSQQGRVQLGKEQIDLLLRGVDLLASLSKRDESNIAGWEADNAARLEEVVAALAQIQNQKAAAPAPQNEVQVQSVPAEQPVARRETPGDAPAPSNVRLTAENLNRLLALAGESLVESRWLRPFSEAMQRLKRMQEESEGTLDQLRSALASLPQGAQTDPLRARVGELGKQMVAAREFLSDRLEDLDLFDRRSAHLSNRLYLEVLRARMRPFGDGVKLFPRMVRDVASGLGKQVALEIIGENTQVDRDILDRLEAPLGHLLRNAVDHGCEFPAERERLGKQAVAIIRLEARHSAGMLQITVTDDGGGIDVERVRRVIVSRKLTTSDLAAQMTEEELLAFLFLPGFSMRETVTEISGRGVGLDSVQNLVKAVRGTVRINTSPGHGTRFVMQLPLTLSVVRTLLVEIAGEPYAFPLAQIVSTLKLSRERIEMVEGREFFKLAVSRKREIGSPSSAAQPATDRPDLRLRPPDPKTQILVPVGLLAAQDVLEIPNSAPRPPGADLPVVVLGEGQGRYGLVVDKFLGERELVVQPLDPRLGKVKDISAAALMEDGAPVLIVDVEDLVRSIERWVASASSSAFRVSGTGWVAGGHETESVRRRKRVLAVDDSLTVRELVRKVLVGGGYEADVAVDGMEGWNAVRAGGFDLVITDVDMPRLDGIELTKLIKQDPNLKTLPVMIVSYKDRAEDRLRGLEAGADYYLTKGSFQDDLLLQAVADLIGEPET